MMIQSQPRQIVQWDSMLKKPFTKKSSGVAQSVGPEFKPQYCQKKKKWTIKLLWNQSRK
jgi:hypothetical protein